MLNLFQYFSAYIIYMSRNRKWTIIKLIIIDVFVSYYIYSTEAKWKTIERLISGQVG